MALLAGCTGQNVDEDFLAEHGVVLARVTCKGRPNFANSFDYDALMFLDGSVMASFIGNNPSDNGPVSASAFYERGDADRVHATVRFGPSSECSGARYTDRYTIDSGDLKWLRTDSECTDSTHATLDVDTQCAGFNKGLFD